LCISGSSVDAPSDRTPVNENGARQLEAEFSIIGAGDRLSASDFGRFYGNLSHNPKIQAQGQNTLRTTANESIVPPQRQAVERRTDNPFAN